MDSATEKKDAQVKPGEVGFSGAGVPSPLPPSEVDQTLDKPRRGRKPGSGKSVEVELAGAVDNLFKPENFKPLCQLPGETAYALTGFKPWLLSKDEAEVLAVSASATAKHFVRTDPKYLALTLFLANIAVIYGSRTVAYYQEKRKLDGKGSNSKTA